MPIKPHFANKIISGEKKYEFRRVPLKYSLSHIIIYSSSPVRNIIGIAVVKDVIISSVNQAWARTRHAAGIERDEFIKYFDGKNTACVIELDKTISFYNSFSPYEIEHDFHVPQSYKYVTTKFLVKVFRKGINGGCR